MKDEILEYIRKHVTEWPEGRLNVRLDRDGEICFHNGTTMYDFYPKDLFKGVFIAGGVNEDTGVEYTREEWEQAQTPAEVISESFSDNETKEIYTQEMFNNGELPSVGMLFTTEAGGKYIVEYANKKSICFTDEHGFLIAITNGYAKPIDQRTDREKAVGDLSKLVGDCEPDYGILQAIIDGKITGVKWVGK